MFASDQYDLRYAECTINCETQDAEWSVQDVETGDELQASDPIPINPGCWASTWWLDGYPSLALDANDIPNISYHAYHVQYCGSSSDYDAWGIRFARPGGSSGGAHRVYLPLIRK